jgi:hypothetical protein
MWGCAGASKCQKVEHVRLMTTHHACVGGVQIATCAVHRSGALLLEQRDGANLGDDLQPVSSEVGAGQAGGPYWAPSAAGAAAAVAQAPCGEAAPGEPMQQDWDGGDGGGFDDDDAFGAGFDDDGDYGPLDPGGEGGPEDDAAQQRHGGGAGPQPAGVAQQEEGEEFDPYKPLDPNSRGTLKAKPFKKAAKVWAVRWFPSLPFFIQVAIS